MLKENEVQAFQLMGDIRSARRLEHAHSDVWTYGH